MNTNRNHTPGPWKTQTHISLDRLEIRDADGRRIAVCAMDFPMSAKTHDANARLIASAPELLDALKRLCAKFGVDDDGWPRDGTVLREARAVIAKAEGRAEK